MKEFIFEACDMKESFISLTFLLLKVASLRQRFNHCINPGGLAGDRHGVVPGSCLSFSAQLLWLKIKKNQNLDLDVHEVAIHHLSTTTKSFNI